MNLRNQPLYLLTISIISFCIFISIYSLYMNSFILVPIYAILMKFIFSMKNRYNKIILITFIVLYLFEVASGSTIRKFLLKNSVYSCYVLDAYDKSKVLDSVKAFGSGDLLISQIMKCNMKNYDDFLIENISIRRNDGLLVVRNFSTIEAAQIYKYLTNKYSLPVRYKEQYIIDIPYIDQKRNERIAEVRNSLINDMKLVKTSTISEK